MRGHSQQPVLQRLAKTGVHGKRDDQRGHARRHSNHREQRDQAQHRRTVRRAQVPPCNKPFKSHGGKNRQFASPRGYVTRRALRKRSLRAPALEARERE